jgi:hypothetical protein
MNYNAHNIRNQILQLMSAYPELVEDEVLREDMIEGSTDAHAFFSEIVRNIGATQAVVVGTIAYIEQLRERKARLERREYALRALIFNVMQAAELHGPITLPEATLSIRNGPKKVVIVNEHELPESYWRVKREPDKTRIKTDLQDGTNVSGAMLSNGEPTLSVRIK